MDQTDHGDIGIVNIVPPKRSFRRVSLLLTLLFGSLFLLILWNESIAPPKDFSPETYIEIPKGNLSDTAKFLKEHSLIRSETIFLFTVQRAGKERGVRAGEYFFKEPTNVFDVATRIMNGDHGMEEIKVTLPEGITAKEMGLILNTKFPVFDMNDFLALTRGEEGYLFPDTYFFYGNATSGAMVLTLEENFNTRTAEAKIKADGMGKKWEDVVIIASLLEEEATTPEDRKLVSGIIWKRLKKNMPLQIDATLGYITGKGSLELTKSDLKNDSPYNTYTHKGLPPTPISNPGLDALDAALHPTTSEYLYYLSDKDGVIHYAKTFEEHKLNKTRYLR